jgi:hypothetical protein
MTPDEMKMWEIFFPFAAAKAQEVQSKGSRFAYYTSAETALKIFRKREIWMRNARTMNDFEEIAYGRDLLVDAYRSPAGNTFKNSLAAMFPDFMPTFENLFNSWLPAFVGQTYITSFSEHLDEEDKLGRLSMWRAYGRNNGVALIANSGLFMSDADALGIYSSPVGYVDSAEMEKQFAAVAQNVTGNREFLMRQGREAVHDRVFAMFQFATLCAKHPGFHEEREWRAVWSPTFGESGKFRREIECIHGVPQTVLKVPLVDYPEEGVVGLELPKLLNRVIVGPTEFGGTIRDALVAALDAAGVSDAASRVVVSDIPLRGG